MSFARHAHLPPTRANCIRQAKMTTMMMMMVMMMKMMVMVMMILISS